jgi:hypothetical protein
MLTSHMLTFESITRRSTCQYSVSLPTECSLEQTGLIYLNVVQSCPFFAPVLIAECRIVRGNTWYANVLDQFREQIALDVLRVSKL